MRSFSFSSLAFIIIVSLFSNRAIAQIESLDGWIPFELVKNHVTITVLIKNKPITAIIDTGANVSAISKKTQKKLKLRKSSDMMNIYGTVGKRLLPLTKKVKIELNQDTYKWLQLAINSKLKNIDLILGMDFIQKPVLQINYKDKLIRFTDNDVVNFNKEKSVPLKLRKGLLYTTIQLEGSEIEMLVDTGNAGDMLVSQSSIIENSTLMEALESKDLHEKKSGIHKASLAYKNNKANYILIGHNKIKDVEYKVIFNDNDHKQRLNVIGYNVLQNFIVSIDRKNKLMMLEPIVVEGI
ncbi:retropepsin-like aspartic protease [Kangiella sp. TOML190]|uniref:retropepsin-like aspartic protease n=1 Tax=Kangiella sp. TOML190 TaxID=2931351 RepID=UPI00203C5E4B|nr:retropepsin-like aspartic protease [Kangiella sp. TOML190]